jgi:hypothetical protein
MAMFDIEDSKHVNLSQNTTSSSDLLRARRVENLTAHNNQAAAIKPAGQESPRRFKWFFDNVMVGVIVGLVLLFIGGLLVWQFPGLQPYIKG